MTQLEYIGSGKYWIPVLIAGTDTVAETRVTPTQFITAAAWFDAVFPHLDAPRPISILPGYLRAIRQLIDKGILRCGTGDGYVLAVEVRAHIEYYCNHRNGRRSRSPWHQRFGTDYQRLCRERMPAVKYAALCDAAPMATPSWGRYWREALDRAKALGTLGPVMGNPLPTVIVGDRVHYDPTTYGG